MVAVLLVARDDRVAEAVELVLIMELALGIRLAFCDCDWEDVNEDMAEDVF